MLRKKKWKTNKLVNISIIKDETWFLKVFYFYFFLTSFIACSQNMYGKNCSLSCGQCFKLEQCHNMNGTCMNGCDSGYNGLNCKEGNFIVYIATKKNIPRFFFYLFNSECDDKHFGTNCIEMCNATCKSCNKSTGMCDNGCHPGWRGLFCEDSMFINMQPIIIKGFFGLIYFVYFKKMFFKTYF